MPARTVLVIDDEDAIRDAVRMILEDAGYAVREAPNGVEGLDLLRASDEPLVVLLDLMMPRMSGVEFLRTVREEPEVAARHAYIICSAARAFTAPTPLRHFLPGKRLLDLPKPFDLDQLVAIVEQAAHQLASEQGGEGDVVDKGEDTNEAAEGEPVPVEAPVQMPSADGTSGDT